MSRHFAMCVSSPQASTAAVADSREEKEAGRLRAGLAARVASGPGLWTEWLAELDRQGLLEELLAEDVIARALREAPPGHKYDRVLTAKMTVICVLVACLFPGAGYDAVLRRRSGCPACGPGRARRSRQAARSPRPGSCSASRSCSACSSWTPPSRTRTSGSAAVERPGGHRDRRHHDGAGQERRARRRVRGTPADGARPLRRPRPHRDLPLDQRRHRRLPRRRERPGRPARRQLRPGILNLADRGFFSMDRLIRFSATGADLAWRVKNGAKSVPLKTLGTLPDGSELVMLHESDGMRARRRSEPGDDRAPAPGHHRPAGPVHRHDPTAAAGRRAPGCGC